MGLSGKIQNWSLNKSSQRFIRQYEYAGKVLYATFADTIDEQLEPGTPENEVGKLCLKYAVAELLGNPSALKESLSKEEKALIIQNVDSVKRFKEEIMNSQPDIREYVVQTVRMLFLYDMMSLKNEEATSEFLKSYEGQLLQDVLSKYGGDYPQPNPSYYDRLCESVAKKTHSMAVYKKMLKGKAF